MSVSGTAQRSGADPRATSWAEVVRLRTLPAAVAPVILGGGAAAALGALSVPRTLLAALPGVAAVCVVGVPDETWGNAVVAAVVPRAGDRLDAEGVRALARARLDGVRAPKRVLVVDALPLRGPGKVDRRSVAALLARA